MLKKIYYPTERKFYITCTLIFCSVSLDEDRNSYGFLGFIILLSVVLCIHMNKSHKSRMGHRS